MQYVWVIVRIKNECIGHGSYIDIAELASKNCYNWQASHNAFLDEDEAVRYAAKLGSQYTVQRLEVYEAPVKEIKGTWFYERSGGFPGHRCSVCATWIPDWENFRCKCDEA